MKAIPSNNSSPGRGVMKLYLISGLLVVALMLPAGLTMRAAQAGWLPALPPDLFYALLTLHGAGMIVALAVCAMGALWFLIRRHIELNAPLAVLAWLLIMLGVVGVVVATLVGRFAGLYTFLYPLPFDGNWPGWSTGVFLISMVLVNAGWMIWSFQMIGAVLRACGGLRGALAWDYVWHKPAFQAAGRQPPPPEALPAFMTGFDGLIAGMAATLLGVSVLVRWLDPRVVIDPLWVKNLTYFWAHTFANLIIYMLAALIYVGMPYATRRTYHTSTVLVVGWWTSMVLTLTNYFHHLYMDFVQPGILQYFGELSSYLSALPVTAVTVFSALMLVWRSRTRWTLGAIFMYSGLVGWVVGGIGAEIDASVPFNVHLHNTLWVPAHFHTYLLGGCLLFVMGWVFLLLESRSARETSGIMRWLIAALSFGGMIVFLLGFYFGGAYGVPRRYAIEPAPGPFIAQFATIGAVIMLIGFTLAFIEGWRLRWNRADDRPLWPGELTEEASHGE
ncbi:MAG TPA: cbb3-type cytochrome c oxidase subunit I [Verrucomicrobiae bacterium]|nr:cbb3-type cytochrome c oxidase subunit I [Verrucomicrobiae bacterium]